MLREKVMRKWWEHEYLIDRFQIFSTSFPFDESRFATRLWTTQSVPRLHHPGCGFTCWTPKFSLLSGKFLLNQGFKSWIAKKKWLFESLARCMVNKWLWRNSVGLARSVRHSELFARVKLKSFHNQKRCKNDSTWLRNLEDCEVYICETSAQVFVDCCKKTFVLLGPCESSAFIRDCEDCTIWCAAQQLRTRECKRCKFYVYSSWAELSKMPLFHIVSMLVSFVLQRC